MSVNFAVAPKLWVPQRVLITPSAKRYPYACAIAERAATLGSEIIELKNERLVGIKGDDERQTYKLGKSTLAIVVSPPSQRKLLPIPPSADWQFHIARGCPAHCQYCYLAGSLPGPPVTRVYANLEEILNGLRDYVGQGSVTSKSPERMNEGTTFEASCYTDPLALEHLTGALAQSITFFGHWDAPVQLRWTTKFDNVQPLCNLEHNRKTRVRFSVNSSEVAKTFEGGTATVPNRISALGKLARAGYPVGLTVAPIMPLRNWQMEYESLFASVEAELSGVKDLDLSVELITHRFTPTSSSILKSWYPASKLDLDELRRVRKRTKFNTQKFVYPKAIMTEMHDYFNYVIKAKLPMAKILYWT